MTPIDWADARKILLVKLSSLGDLVHVTPVLRALRRQAPAAQILMAVEGRFASVLRYNPNIDGIIEASSTARGWLPRLLDARRALSRHVRPRFDAALDFQGRWRSAVWLYTSRARVMAGRGGVRPGWHTAVQPDMEKHAVQVCAEVAEKLGLEVGDLEPEIFHCPRADLQVGKILESAGVAPDGFVLINPFSRWRSKEWILERYAELMRRLGVVRDLDIVISGGTDRTDDAERLLAGVRNKRVTSLVGRLTLEQAICLYRRARLMVTGDSGPMHVAAALGTPVIALFGPTLPEQTGPWGRHCRVMQRLRPPHHHTYLTDSRREHMAAIDLDTVHAAVIDGLFQRRVRRSA
jgi:ADP-heptose:LPS heptosyltransferase